MGSLAVRVLGEGPPAVLWHSLFVDERSWQRVEDGLAGDRRLVIITGPGHGASADPGHRYSLDDCAAAAGEVLAALDIREPVDWVGNAWGGHVGVVFAATWPDRCRTLVTLGTPIQAYGRSEQLLFRVMLAVYRVVGMVDFLSSGICDALLSAADPRERSRGGRAGARQPAHDGAAGLANAMVSISLGRPDLTPRLASIRCPTLFVTGSDHAEWTGEQAECEEPAARQGSAAVVPDTAYLIPLEASSHALIAGSAAVVPDTAYLTPIESPESTIRLVRDHWSFPLRAVAPG